MYNHNPSVSSITKTSCQCNIKDTFSGSWCIIAIGVQQWGYVTSNGENVTITLPISFAEACYGAMVTMDREVGYALMVTYVSTNKITVYTRNARGVYFLVIGK